MAAAASRLLHFPASASSSRRQYHNRHHQIVVGSHRPDQSLPSSFPAVTSISLPHSSSSPLRSQSFSPNLLQKSHFSCASAAGGNGSDGVGWGNGGGGSDGWGAGENSDDSSSSSSSWVGPVGAFLNGWRSRVAADPQFPFKVLMEELVGVSACVLGDMASRPNFGLNELDFVFSTLVVGCILNFVLMYLLAPTMSSASSATLPSIFANCPTSHMFEPGPYGFFNRFGTFVYKGVLFAGVGFAAGLVGTAISNGLIMLRKKMDPNFETPNKPPPTILNAATWAIHMGFSSNLRYQSLNGVEFVLANTLPPVAFKTSVVVLRCLNNILGGMTFVILARLTGSQSVGGGGGGEEKHLAVTTTTTDDEAGSSSGAMDKEKLLSGSEEDPSSNQST